MYRSSKQNINIFSPATKTRGIQVAGKYHTVQSGWLSMGTSKSGVEVNLTTAEKHTVVMSCYKIISESLAVLPIHLMTKSLKKGKPFKKMAYNHKLYDILHLNPNDEMTQYECFESVCMNLVSRGNGYFQILRDRRGDFVGLYPLLTDNMEIVRTEEGRLGYKYRSEFLKTTVLLYPYEEVLHIKWSTKDGIHGMSPIAYSADLIGYSIALQEHGTNHFKNGTLPSGFFTTPQTISNESREVMRKQLDDRYSGLSNSQKTLLLEQGMEFKTISIPNNDAQYLESMEFTASQICSIFRVPPHMVNLMSSATFTNIESQGVSFASNTMLPVTRRFEQPLNKLLAKEKTKKSKKLFAFFDLNILKSGDMDSRFTAYSTAIQNGFYTRNEVREKENLNPLKGLDEPLTPLNMDKGDSKNGKKEK